MNKQCLCDHDLFWHGVGIGHSACRAHIYDGGLERMCHCQGFRTSVPGATMPEPDLLQMLWRLDMVLSRIEATLRELVPAKDVVE